MNTKVKLNKQEIDNISSFEVVNKIFQYTFKFDSKELNSSQKALHNIFIIEGDVDNGGFIQFFQNTQDEFFKSGLEAFKLIGDLKTQKVFTEAIEIYYRNEPFLSARDLKAPLEKSDELKLESLDNKFYDVGKEREKKLNEYMKRHVNDFVDSRSNDTNERVYE